MGALSPLIGASLLYHIDLAFAARDDFYYARYMDDFIVLARTRWRLRSAVADLNGLLAEGGFAQYPDKTWIGLLAHGVDWLGGWFTSAGWVGIALNALQRYRSRSLRLYEQALRDGLDDIESRARVQAYRGRWQRIIAGG